MPIPQPSKGDKKPDFIIRCMSDAVMRKDYPKQAQRYAICISQWERKDKKK